MTRAQRKNLSIKMKAVYAKKKAGKGQKKFDFEPAANMVNTATFPTPDSELKLIQHEDARRNAEFQFRRGLVTAMECILRELR